MLFIRCSFKNWGEFICLVGAVIGFAILNSLLAGLVEWVSWDQSGRGATHRPCQIQQPEPQSSARTLANSHS